MMLMTSAIPAVLASDVRFSVALVSIATFGYTGASPTCSRSRRTCTPRTLWVDLGLASMGSGFGGMLFSLATGWVVSRFSYTPVFIGFGLLPLVACAILLFVTCSNLTQRGNSAS